MVSYTVLTLLGIAALLFSFVLVVLMTVIYMIVDRSRDRLTRSVERVGKHAEG